MGPRIAELLSLLALVAVTACAGPPPEAARPTPYAGERVAVSVAGASVLAHARPDGSLELTGHAAGEGALCETIRLAALSSAGEDVLLGAPAAGHLFLTVEEADTLRAAARALLSTCGERGELSAEARGLIFDALDRAVGAGHGTPCPGGATADGRCCWEGRACGAFCIPSHRECPDPPEEP